MRKITFRQFVFREPHVGELCTRFQLYSVGVEDGSLKAIDQRLAERLHSSHRSSGGARLSRLNGYLILLVDNS